MTKNAEDFVLNISVWDFGFVSDFEFRISDLIEFVGSRAWHT